MVGRITNDQKAKTTSKQRHFSSVLRYMYLLDDREMPDSSSHGVSRVRGVINKARCRVEVVFSRVSALLRPKKLVDILYVRRDAQRLRAPDLYVAIVRAGLGDMDGRATILPRLRQAAGPPFVVEDVAAAHRELSWADDRMPAVEFGFVEEPTGVPACASTGAALAALAALGAERGVAEVRRAGRRCGIGGCGCGAIGDGCDGAARLLPLAAGADASAVDQLNTAHVVRPALHQSVLKAIAIYQRSLRKSSFWRLLVFPPPRQSCPLSADGSHLLEREPRCG